MDLREKPGKVQKVLEILMRIRLLSVVGLVIATIVLLISHWKAVVALPAAASESLGIWMSDFSMDKILGSGKYLAVTAIATLLLFAIFGRVRGFLSSLVAMVLSVGGIFLLGDVGENFNKPMIFFAILAGVSLVGILFAKLSVFCGLFPFMLGWLFLSSVVAALIPSLEPAYLTWLVLSAIGFAGAMSLSTVAGKYLSEGMPQGGALSRAAKQMVLPVIASSVLAVCAIAFDMPAPQAAETSGAAASGTDNVLYAVLYFFVFNLWFFVILFPIMTFAPWDRLRSGSRRVEMKDKKKPSAKGKKK
ncbi:MAG: hypothetical protein MJY87_10250 [Fibrobacter sp.]|nr:hypothetical protein [Fibrobacter sp.]